jgi:hypothetical protein
MPDKLILIVSLLFEVNTRVHEEFLVDKLGEYYSLRDILGRSGVHLPQVGGYKVERKRNDWLW